MAIEIKCANCAYARQDKKASTYTKKHCAKCEQWADCPICAGCKKREGCKSRLKQTNKQSCDRRCDAVCSEQTLIWKAVECGNPESEYYKALLNVTPNGDKQLRVTWSGCPCGERRNG
jgi:hypothetical protein